MLILWNTQTFALLNYQLTLKPMVGASGMLGACQYFMHCMQRYCLEARLKNIINIVSPFNVFVLTFYIFLKFAAFYLTIYCPSLYKFI